MAIKVYPARTRLGDSCIGLQHALSLCSQSKVILYPNPKVFTWPERLQLKVKERFEFLFRLVKNKNLTYKWALVKPPAKQLPKNYTGNLQFVTSKEAKTIILFDFNPSTGFNRPSLAQIQLILNPYLQQDLICISALASRFDLNHVIPFFQRAKLFIGCDSGFAHVAALLNIPTILYRFNAPAGKLERWHSYHPYTLLPNP